MKPTGDPIRPPKNMGGSRLIGPIFALMFLSGCATVSPSLVVHKNVVYVPPASLFNCPLSPLPQSFKTNGDVASTLNSTYTNNVTCHNNMKTLQADLNNQHNVFNK